MKFKWFTVAAVAVSRQIKYQEMEESWIMLNSVPTHIFTWGQRAQDTFDKDISEIVLMISGNPGLPGFYTSFCSTLFNELDKKIPCWLIGHAGDDYPRIASCQSKLMNQHFTQHFRSRRA